MEEYLDEICLLGFCGALLAWPLTNPFAVVGFLAVVVVACARSAAAPIRIACEVLFVAGACVLPSFLAFLPVAVYCLVHEKPWLLRLLWLVPLGVQLVIGGIDGPWVQVALTCLIGCVLAIRDRRSAALRAGITHAYDGLRERVFEDKKGERGTVPQDVAVEPSEPLLFAGLTKREIAIAQLVAEGMDNREISQQLFLSEGTVRNHISAILQKKNLSNRTQIAVMYYRS